jgi:hypothetical protein
MTEGHQPRQSIRVAVSAEIEFRRHGEQRFPTDLHDLSPEGCRIAPPITVEESDQVFIFLPGLESIHGKVCWVRAWQAGIQFDHPLHPAVFDMIIARLDQPGT